MNAISQVVRAMGMMIAQAAKQAGKVVAEVAKVGVEVAKGVGRAAKGTAKFVGRTVVNIATDREIKNFVSNGRDELGQAFTPAFEKQIQSGPSPGLGQPTMGEITQDRRQEKPSRLYGTVMQKEAMQKPKEVPKDKGMDLEG